MTTRKHPEALAGFPVIVALPIQWGDQDAFGHVNNTVSIRWFETARIAYLEHGGLGHLMDVSGLGPILAAIQCNYRRQVHYPDTVHIAARVTKIGRTSMVMEHAVYSERLEAIVSEGASTVVMFDYAANKPRRMPPEVFAMIERIEGKSLS